MRSTVLKVSSILVRPDLTKREKTFADHKYLEHVHWITPSVLSANGAVTIFTPFCLYPSIVSIRKSHWWHIQRAYNTKVEENEKRMNSTHSCTPLLLIWPLCFDCRIQHLKKAFLDTSHLFVIFSSPIVKHHNPLSSNPIFDETLWLVVVVVFGGIRHRAGGVHKQMHVWPISILSLSLLLCFSLSQTHSILTLNYHTDPQQWHCSA